jgi:holo-[acyl-carrier protein] synthase|tara:strand:+ start:230 stop:610 length:381 start_codon:yes stop_codon:yes gene_type:complete
MSIFGIGSDIIEIIRLKRAFKNKNFKKKIFSENEIKDIDKRSNKISGYAKRFAAKEAFSKALGTGVSAGISFKEISINNDKKGKPYIVLHGKTKSIVQQKIKKRYRSFLTLSDEKKFALATVIITY